ncbi:hypothetical protein GCM10010243_21800 [Streptomyces matensis]|nr:hypothetical protein GCM10010243_21800 [Streptomyces matensis]
MRGAAGIDPGGSEEAPAGIDRGGSEAAPAGIDRGGSETAPAGIDRGGSETGPAGPGRGGSGRGWSATGSSPAGGWLGLCAGRCPGASTDASEPPSPAGDRSGRSGKRAVTERPVPQLSRA